MQKIFTLLLSSMLALTASATVIFTEDFNYTTLTAEGSGWTETGVTGESPRTLVECLTYSDVNGEYVYSNTGKALQNAYAGSTGHTDYTSKSMTKQQTGDIYLTFLLRADASQGQTASEVVSLSNTDANPGLRVFAGKDTSGNPFRLGLLRTSSGSSSDIHWTTKTISINTVHLVVVHYNFTNQTASLYINPELGGEKPADADVVDDSFGTAKNYFNYLYMRNNGNNKSNFTIGGIQVSNTWEEAVAYNKPGTHFEQGFDVKQPTGWSVDGCGYSASENHGDFGTTVHALSFNINSSGVDYCTATVETPRVNSADELVFWMKGSSNTTIANLTVEKVVDEEVTQLAYYPGTFGKEWTKYTIPVQDTRKNIKFVFTIGGCEQGKGTLYLDDISLGSFSAIEIDENTDNETVLTANYNKEVNVIMHRTFPSASFSTICLPFKLETMADVAAVFGEGVEVKRLSSTAEEDGALVMNFSNPTTMAAGQPFLIKPAEDVVDPIFRNVTILKRKQADVDKNNITAGDVIFHGVLNPMDFASENKNLLILGAENTLYWVQSGMMKGFRAYFEIKEGAGVRAGMPARVVMHENTATGLTDAPCSSQVEAEKLLRNGQLIIRRGEAEYTVDGQRIK